MPGLPGADERRRRPDDVGALDPALRREVEGLLEVMGPDHRHTRMAAERLEAARGGVVLQGARE